MITPAYGLTATERVLPSFVLDWTTGLAQDAVDVTRAGVATFFGSDGLVQSAAENTQRVDYSTGVPGILVEESRTNSLSYSQDFRNTADAGETRPWVYSRITLEQDTLDVLAPDGTNTAAKVIETTETGFHILSRNPTITAGSTQSVSFFIRPNGRTNISVFFRSDSFTNGFFAEFNLASQTKTDGSVGTGSLVSSSLTALPNGWFLLTVVGTIDPSATVGGLQVILGNYTGDGTSGIYIWGAQLEEGAFPTSYIPTEASAVTRNADVATVTGTNFSDFFNATEGTFAVQASVYSLAQSNRLFSVDDTTSNNRIDVYSNTSGQIRYFIETSGVSQQNLTPANTIASQTTFNVAFGYKENNAAVVLNGGGAALNTSVLVPTVTQAQIGASTAIDLFFGHVQKIQYWPYRLTNAEVQAFSK